MTDDRPTFRIGQRVRKKSGSAWHGRIVGTYQTALTADGYCVESEREPGSVQIYPANALMAVDEETTMIPHIVKDRYWHGGPPGINRGAYLLPPSVTKVPSLSEYGAAGVHRHDRVYVTTSQTTALLYAAGVKQGVIYECEPLGDLEPDPDCSIPGLWWQCEKARVIRCIKPK